jgi:hypothetical protein
LCLELEKGVEMRRLGDERGASAVEFAIIASLLFMILFGTIQFGITFNRYQSLQSAGREGARLGSLTQTTRAQILDRVKESVSIIPATAFAGTANCPTNINSIPLEDACINLLRRQAPGSTPVELSGAGDQPCSGSQPGTNKSVIVQVYYRIEIQIPLWTSPQMTIGGSGEFKCEGS